MLLLIDNYDSFTFNLAQYFMQLGQEVRVERNDVVTVDAVEREIKPARLVISPGPGTPRKAGISLELIKRMAGKAPILGVCLGHQAIAEAYGGKVVQAPTLMHGKTSPITHDGKGIYAGIENPFVATRYHSLVVEPKDLPDCLEVSAKTAEGVIMGLRHKELPVEGVQFHPESILTTVGMQLLKNWLK
ncbi:MAG: aminodeoxychorismate/anthranilate synthase component II [Planctomycetes bacterium]|nr:aminodeoxychorismate/anthranilate synthase component II [Planctomycetota bacterium]